MTKDQLIQGNTLNEKMKAIGEIRTFLKAGPLTQETLSPKMGQHLLTIQEELDNYLDVISQSIYEEFQKL